MNEMTLHKLGSILIQLIISETGEDKSTEKRDGTETNYYVTRFTTQKDLLGRIKICFEQVVDCTGEVNAYINVNEILELGKMKNFV